MKDKFSLSNSDKVTALKANTRFITGKSNNRFTARRPDKSPARETSDKFLASRTNKFAAKTEVPGHKLNS